MNLTATLARVGKVFRDYFGPWSSSDPGLGTKLFGTAPVQSGVNVSPENALNLSAVWACVQLIAGNLASLPLVYYRSKPNGDRQKAIDTRLYHLLHDEPNEDMSAATFLESMQMAALLWGNAFAEIRRDGAGRVAELYPIEPWRVQARRRTSAAGPLVYLVANGAGPASEIEPENMLHVPALSSNGIWGYSVVSKARESLGLTMAEELSAASFFGKGMTPGGILTAPAFLKSDQIETLRASLERRHQGPDRAHQFLILQGGMTYTPLTMPGRDAQFLEQRTFQLGEIARWFGVPPHLIGDTEKSTSWGTGIQQQTIGFLQFTLRPWIVKWERELNRKLISPLERNLQLIEFTVDALERGDQESRYRAYQTGLLSGFLTINQVRAFENWPTIPGADELMVPGNMTTLERLKNPPAPPVPPAPEPEPEEEEEEPVESDTARMVAEIIEGTRPDFAPVEERLEHGLTAIREEVRAELAARPAPEPVAPAIEAMAGRLDALTVAHEDIRARLDEEVGKTARVTAEARILARAIVPTRAMIETGARELARRERDRARKAAGDPLKFAAWAEGFYAGEFERLALERLRGAVALYGELCGRAVFDAEAVLLRHVRAYALVSLEHWHALMLAAPADLRAEVEAVTARWELERPAMLADALTTTPIAEEVAHAT